MCGRQLRSSCQYDLLCPVAEVIPTGIKASMWWSRDGYMFLWSQVKTFRLIRRQKFRHPYSPLSPCNPNLWKPGSRGHLSHHAFALLSLCALHAPGNKLVCRMRADSQKSWSLLSHLSALRVFQSHDAHTAGEACCTHCRGGHAAHTAGEAMLLILQGRHAAHTAKEGRSEHLILK